jgi:hypothetical protein
MGEEFASGAAEVRITAHVAGDAPLARLDVIRNGEIAHSRRAAELVEDLAVVLPAAAGETAYFYLRAVQRDGQIGWASPFWLTHVAA